MKEVKSMKGKSCHRKNCKMENCVKEKHEWKTRNGKTGSGKTVSSGYNQSSSNNLTSYSGGKFQTTTRPRVLAPTFSASVTLPNRTVRNRIRKDFSIASTPKNHKPDYSSPCLSTLLKTLHRPS